MTRRTLAEIALIGLLCFLAYAPALSIPLMEDDYGNLDMAQAHGSLAGIAGLFHDPIFRVRATSYWLMYAVWKVFGLSPVASHAASLGLHVANCWLIYAILRSRSRALTAPEAVSVSARKLARPDSVAFWAAAFFAVHEGHQEAIMWWSAVNELLMFLFGAGSMLCWMAAGRKDLAPARSRAWEAASVGLFALALVSKESAVIWLPLFLLLGTRFYQAGSQARRKAALRLAPHIVVAAVAIASVWATREYSFRFSDGSFSWRAPFWITWPRGAARLLWPWGWLALAAIGWLGGPRLWRQALAWIAIALLPYSFLTYSTQIPSRQTYLASAGLAVLFGVAAASLLARPGAARKLAVAGMAAMLASSVGYLWSKKRAQFLARAEPTEQLIRLARSTPEPIWVQCFPRNRYIAEEAVRVGAGRSPGMLVWNQAEAAERRAAATFCYRER